MTSLLCKVLHLCIDLVFAHFDVIVRKFVCVRKFVVELRSESDVEHEFKFALVFDVLRLLLFRHHRFAKDVHLVLVDVVHQTFTQHAVDGVSFHLCAKAFLNNTSRHLTRTETRHLSFCRDILELFLYCILVVALFQLYSYKSTYTILFESNLHSGSIFILLLIILYLVRKNRRRKCGQIHQISLKKEVFTMNLAVKPYI